MPMNWTAENDRILLLKLIETHAVKIIASKIEEAWPEGSVKPTARAITERFVKLRQMTGIKLSVGGSTPSKNHSRVSKPNTPASSAKKRKLPRKKASSDSEESDADGHMTDDTPSKPSKFAKPDFGDSHDGNGFVNVPPRKSPRQASKPPFFIKAEEENEEEGEGEEEAEAGHRDDVKFNLEDSASEFAVDSDGEFII